MSFEFPTVWEVEICERCGQTTEYDRDYGGPFPTGDTCPFDDCPVNKDGTFYSGCPSTRTITVQEAKSG